MINQLTICTFTTLPGFDLANIETHLEPAAFQPTGATQQQSAGWVPPRGIAHAALHESIGGHIILKVCQEKRAVPGQTIKARVAELAAAVEEQTGRKPGKKLTKELKEQALLELLPMAFVKQAHTPVWIDVAAGRLIIGTASTSRADDIASLLVKSLQGQIAVHTLNTEASPAACMAAWLVDDLPPHGFTLDRECELKSCDEQKSVVRYARHRLDTEEVKAHVKAGKVPTRIAMTWGDRVSFILSDSLSLKKVAFLDVAMQSHASTAGTADDAFDADAAITTGELSPLITELIHALGGMSQPATQE